MSDASPDLADTPPKIGDIAPDFDLAVAGGGRIASDTLRGRPYLIYFYPKASTPGCTTQACDIQEMLPEFGRLDLTVIGVSPDAVPALDRFAAAQGLAFPLASDPSHILADAYGVWVEKTMYGRTYFGMERSSFLVDASGVIRAIWRKVKPAEHAALVKEAAAAL